MRVYFFKFFIVLAFVFFVYFVGMQGCSTTTYFAGGISSCDDFPTDFGCEIKTPEIIPPDIEDDSSPEYRSRYVDFKYEVPSGQLDIIFVIDNSSSMAQEHRSLSNQFDRFLKEGLRYVDYHIAVITTDISKSPNNPVRNASYQDGKFINIGGNLFLKNNNIGQQISQQDLEDFKKAVVRQETLGCDKTHQPKSHLSEFYGSGWGDDTDSESVVCPSSDERGIYALNLAIFNPSHNSFFRSGSHLMFIILSDEDERSVGFEEGYPFEAEDYSETLVKNIHNRFSPMKTFSVYPIIIPPGHRKCLNEQNALRGQGPGTGGGYYGYEYARLAKAQEPSLLEFGNLVSGKVISICDRKYDNQLRRIAILANTVRIPLPCSDPHDIKLTVNGQKQTPINKRIEGRTLVIEPGKIKLGSKVKVEVQCLEKVKN